MKDGDISSHTGLALALAQSVFNEGLSVLHLFNVIRKRFGKMKGMGTIVEWSIRDETHKVMQNCLEIFVVTHVLSQMNLNQNLQVADIVKLEDKFIDAYNDLK